MGMQSYAQRALTLKVRRALEMIGLENEAKDTVNALGTRGLVVIEREKLIDEKWLTERIVLLHAAADIRSYDMDHPV